MEILAMLVLGIVIIGSVVIVQSVKKPKTPKYTSGKSVCPRCGKSNYHAIVQKEVIVPEKKKTQSSVNLNPLKPFTVMDHKEKVVRKEISRDVTKFVCDNCGNIWGYK